MKMWMILLGTAFVFLVIKALKLFRYWNEQGIECLSPWETIVGIFKSLMRTKALGEMILDIYNQFPNSRYHGAFQFHKPLLIVRDPELIKQIAVKDFDNFENRRSVVATETEYLWDKNLFSLKGEEWRDMRATLSPAFSSSKMKTMFGLISECAEQFALHFYNKDEEIINLEMKDTFTRFTNDIVASTAFGVKCDSLTNRNNEFYLMGKEVTDFSGIKFWKLMLMMIFPPFQKIFGNTIFSKKVSTFFRNLVKETMQLREKEGIIRPDMIHLLMEAQKGRLRHEEIPASGATNTGFATVEESNVGRAHENEKRELTDDDITAQALLFFFAGFDSVSTLMCFLAYELAINPEIQERLQAEVDDTYQKCNTILTYEALSKMKYMDMVVSETLRKWPSSPVVDRMCSKPYTIEPKTPKEKPVHFKEGDLLWLPIFGLHRDPKYFPHPDKFDPERFSDENKHKVQMFSYIPFGAGPRNCMGCRFALLETKAVMFYLLTKFNMVAIKHTQIPLRLSKKQFNMSAEDGIWLGLKRRQLT